MTSTLDELVARLDLPLTADEIVRELASVLEPVSDPESSPLTRSEVDFLREHGGSAAGVAMIAVDPRSARAERAAGAVRGVAALVESTLGVEEVAQRLGVDRSRVSHRLSKGSLWAVTVGRHRRIPRWQLVDAQLLPGLAEVVAAIPAGLDPLTLDALMYADQPELGDQSPVDFLAAGGEPGVVAGLVADLGRW